MMMDAVVFTLGVLGFGYVAWARARGPSAAAPVTVLPVEPVQTDDPQQRESAPMRSGRTYEEIRSEGGAPVPVMTRRQRGMVNRAKKTQPL